jgi:hypothetical protein
MMPMKPGIFDSRLPLERDTWRRRVHDLMGPIMRTLMAYAREHSPLDVKDRKGFTLEYRREYRSAKSVKSRGRPTVRLVVPGVFHEYMPALDAAMAAIADPEDLPRWGFKVKVQVMPGWGRWVIYVRGVYE